MFTGHLLGDAASPYVIGSLSTRIGPGRDDFSEYEGLQLALYSMPFVLSLGALAFLLCSLYCHEDHVKAIHPEQLDDQLPVLGNDNYSNNNDIEQ